MATDIGATVELPTAAVAPGPGGPADDPSDPSTNSVDATPLEPEPAPPAPMDPVAPTDTAAADSVAPPDPPDPPAETTAQRIARVHFGLCAVQVPTNRPHASFTVTFARALTPSTRDPPPSSPRSSSMGGVVVVLVVVGVVVAVGVCVCVYVGLSQWGQGELDQKATPVKLRAFYEDHLSKLGSGGQPSVHERALFDCEQ